MHRLIINQQTHYPLNPLTIVAQRVASRYLDNGGAAAPTGRGGSAIYQLTSKLFLTLILSLGLGACTTNAPAGIQAVEAFDLSRYLGQWYEIARLDHSFERGMDRVTADYSLREDGGVRVLNRGLLSLDQRWKEAEGRAYFVGEADTGHLKVSFFGPFYGAYVIIELDPAYQYSMVAGPSFDYLWILSRSPKLDKAVLDRLIARANALGFDSDKLIFPDQSG